MKKNSNKTKKQKISSQMTAAAEAKENFVFNLGIDLGDKNCEVCVFDRKGESQESFRLPLKAESLRLYLLSIPRSRFAIEAGGQSRWVAELIERLGHQVFVSNGKKVAYTSESDDKHDPGDAYKLGELLAFKPRLLHPIQHRSQEAQADLSWIRSPEVVSD